VALVSITRCVIAHNNGYTYLWLYPKILEIDKIFTMFTWKYRCYVNPRRPWKHLNHISAHPSLSSYACRIELSLKRACYLLLFYLILFSCNLYPKHTKKPLLLLLLFCRTCELIERYFDRSTTLVGHKTGVHGLVACPQSHPNKHILCDACKIYA
jgi:hypothetical protein